MSDNSAIEWTDATWNPVTGCTKVSPGCDHCYAETFAERWRGTPGHYFERGFDVQLRPDKLTLPLRWRKPRRVFVNSMSDLFHDSVPDEYIARVFGVMALAGHHTFQVLTKRHGRMRALLRSAYFFHEVSKVWGNPPADWPLPRDWTIPPWPLPNVWLGVSVENQRWADIRIPALYDTPAAVRFLSCEPLLGPVEIGIGDPHRNHRREHQGDYNLMCLDCSTEDNDVEWFRRDPGAAGLLHWVIAGGESGAGARPVDLDWVRALRDECQQAKVPFLFKQVGGRTPKAGGRELDGRTWDEYPAVTP